MRLLQLNRNEERVSQIVNKTHLPKIFHLVLGTDGIPIVMKEREVFNIMPSTLAIVSDRSDEVMMNSMGIPNIRVRDGGYGTNYDEASIEYPINRMEIMDKITQAKNQWNFKLIILTGNLCGGTSGYGLNVLKDTLATFTDVKCIMMVKLPTASFSTYRQRQNIKSFFLEYEEVWKSYTGRISLILYTDEGAYGALDASEWIADFVSSMMAALGTRIVPVNTLPQLCEELGSTGRAQTLGAPFLINTAKSGEEGFSVVEGAIRSLQGQVAENLLDVDFALTKPFQVWGVLCYPMRLEKTLKEISDIKNKLAGLIKLSMKEIGLDSGFATIEPVPFGTTWKLYGIFRGIEIKSINGMTI
jgi:hypothetical protein